MSAQAAQALMPCAPGRGAWPKAVPLLILAGLLAYSNSFTKAFVLDDPAWITGNRDIGSLRRMAQGDRPVVRVSIWLNHRLGGFQPAGYHALNLAVHLLAGLTLFGIVRRVLRLPRFAGRYDDEAEFLAFAVALLWLVHPLQTQAVTYVIQRCESMMGLFYLFAIYAWLRGATGGGRWWYAVTACSFAISSGCKEIAVTLPPVLLAFDRVFLAASWRELARRWPAYLAVLVVWAGVLYPFVRPLAARAAEVDPEAQSFAVREAAVAGVGFDIQTATPYTYLLTQSEVILHYLRLAVWPVGQAFDYVDWPIARSLADVWPAFLAVSGMLVASLALLYLRRAAGFIGFWFFAILAPTSSVVPIVDPAFEHRMYLSLAAVAVGVVFGARALGARLGWPDRKRAAFGVALLGGAALVLASLTYARNETYRTQMVNLEHASAARPNNPRPYVSMAALYVNAGELDRAEAALLKADAIPGTHILTARTRGPLLALRGRFAEAESAYREVLRSLPYHSSYSPRLYRWLAWVRVTLGKSDLAAETVRVLIARQPESAENHLTLAGTLLAAGRDSEARAAAAEARRLDPASPRSFAAEARQLLFAADSTATPLNKARALWQCAAACLADGDPDPMMLDTLAMAYAAHGRFEEAVSAAQRGVSAAKARGDAEWVAALQSRLKLYETGKPYAPVG